MISLSLRKFHVLNTKSFFGFSSIQSVKGMKDMVDEDMQKFDFIRRKSVQIFKKYGYQEILGNILEHEELFQRSLGETSEIIQKEMYRFQDLSGRKLVLRPEGTAGIARMFIEKGMGATTLPKKYFYCGPMYRYEKPQKGRFRQFYQLGVENIGSGDTFSDIELLTMADSLLSSLKKKKNFYKIEINTLGDNESRTKYSQALKAYFNQDKIISRLSDLSKIRLENNPLRILDSKEKQDIELLNDCPKLTDFLTASSKASYEKIKKSLDVLKVNYVENPNLVRGLDYYTELCFEIKYTGEDEEEKTKDTLLGGGRYDLLIGQLRGSKLTKDQVPAVGFAAGIERLMLLLDENDDWRKSEKEYKKVGIAFIRDKEAGEEVNEALKLKAVEIPRLFGEQEKITFEATYHINKIDKQMQFFDKKNFDYVILLGPDELKEQKVKVKNLQNGEQNFIDLTGDFAQNFINKFIR